jgi:DNA-binding LytR/AlgR family response regulator
MDYLKMERIDLMFLDIKMPDISGIELLTSLVEPPMTIITTAYSEHAVQGFELNVIDYLLKPFSQARFLMACNKAYEKHALRNRSRAVEEEDATMFVKTGYEEVRVKVNDILYVQSSGNYVQFILCDQKLLSRLTMNEAQEQLPSAAFVRIHRSYIVRMKVVTKIEKNTVWIKDIALPVGPGYQQEIDRIKKIIS